MPLKRMVLAYDEQGSPRAIGPVYKDESVEKLRDQVEEAGWTNLGTAVVMSMSDFRAEAKRVAP